MLIEVIRVRQHDTYTVGNLSVDGKHICMTLEDPVREVEGQPVQVWKEPGQTAIPVGRYAVEMTYSNRFQRIMPQLMNVPGFSGVRIHSGNTDADTEGCLLVGMSWGGTDFISESRIALEKVYPLIQEAWDDKDKITLVIS